MPAQTLAPAPDLEPRGRHTRGIDVDAEIARLEAALHAPTEVHRHVEQTAEQSDAARDLGHIALVAETGQFEAMPADALDLLPRQHVGPDGRLYNMQAAYNMFETPVHTEWQGKPSVKEVLAAHKETHASDVYLPTSDDWYPGYTGRHRAPKRRFSFLRARHRS